MKLGENGYFISNDGKAGEPTGSIHKYGSRSSVVRSLTSIVESIHSCEDVAETPQDDGPPEEGQAKVEPKSERKEDIVVLIAAFILSTLLGMNWIAFPVFYVEFSEYFGQSKFVTGFIGSVQNALSQLLHLFISSPIQIYGCRPVAIIGGIVLCLGYTLSCFAPNIHVLYITYGLIGGKSINSILFQYNMSLDRIDIMICN